MENAEKIITTIVAVILILALIISAIGSVQTSQTIGNTTNETVTLSDGLVNQTGTLADDDLIALDGLRNSTYEDIIGDCNVTLSTGILSCDYTEGTTAYADYRYYPTEYIQATGTRTLFLLTSIILVISIILFVMKKGKK